MDNKNSPLNLLEEMKQYLSAADRLRQRMEERLRSLYGGESPSKPPDEPGGPEDEGEDR